MKVAPSIRRSVSLHPAVSAAEEHKTPKCRQQQIAFSSLRLRMKLCSVLCFSSPTINTQICACPCCPRHRATPLQQTQVNATSRFARGSRKLQYSFCQASAEHLSEVLAFRNFAGLSSTAYLLSSSPLVVPSGSSAWHVLTICSKARGPTARSSE